MGKKLTKDQINKDLREEGRKIQLIGELVNSRTKAEFNCMICNHYWYATPTRVRTSKSGCPKCAGTLKLTKERINMDLKKENRNLVLEREYINARTPAKFRCTKCNYIWYPLVCNIRQGTDCPTCAPASWLTGYVYIMTSSLGTKIGISKHPEERRKQVSSSGNIKDLTIFGLYQTNPPDMLSSSSVEKLVHSTFKSKGKQLLGFDGASEFFDVPPQEVEDLLLSLKVSKV